MLVNPHGPEEGGVQEPKDQEVQQKYETMQCFAVSEPKSIKEEGEGTWMFVKPLSSNKGLMLNSWNEVFSLS